jgi:hypothetical protein
MNVFDIEPREWNRVYFPMLDYKSLLNLLVTSKQLNKKKSIIYRLIYIKIFNEIIPEEIRPFYGSLKEVNINLYKNNIDEIKNITRVFLRNTQLCSMLIKHAVSDHNDFKMYRRLFIECFHIKPLIPFPNIDCFIKKYCKMVSTYS